jgi:hypothetical protein
MRTAIATVIPPPGTVAAPPHHQQPQRRSRFLGLEQFQDRVDPIRQTAHLLQEKLPPLVQCLDAIEALLVQGETLPEPSSVVTRTAADAAWDELDTRCQEIEGALSVHRTALQRLLADADLRGFAGGVTNLLGLEQQMESLVTPLASRRRSYSARRQQMDTEERAQAKEREAAFRREEARILFVEKSGQLQEQLDALMTAAKAGDERAMALLDQLAQAAPAARPMTPAGSMAPVAALVPS